MKKLLETRNVYICLSLMTLIACTTALLVSSGRLFQIFFFIDPNDTFMDFFNSMIEAAGGKPYTDYYVIYPPLSNLFFYLISLFIPEQIRSTWPATHNDVQSMVGTVNDIRHHQSALMVFLLIFLITLFIIAALIHSYTRSYLLTFCLTFSSGMLFCIERGNVIIIAFLLTVLFLKYYDDSSAWKRELALISLAAAFGFKLYPAFFGIILLRDRKFAATARAILYAVILTILPALIMGEADKLIPWLQNIFGISTASNGTAIISGEPSAFPISFLIMVLLLVFLLIDLILKLLNKKSFDSFLSKSEYMFILTTAMALFSNNTSGYILIFYIIPFLLFLNEESKLTKKILLEFIVYLAALLPFGINNMSYPILLLFVLGLISKRQIIRWGV